MLEPLQRLKGLPEVGFRFRRSIRLAPGLRINLSKSGPSLSVGSRDATMNFGPRGKKMTVGVPGTGLSYQATLGRSGSKQTTATSEPNNLATVAYSDTSGTKSRAKSGHLGWLLLAAVLGFMGFAALMNSGSGPTTSIPSVKVTAPSVTAAVTDAVAPPTVTSQEPQPAREWVEVSASANIRRSPRPDAAVMGFASRHARYGVFGRSGAWTQIGNGSAIGWVGNSRLEPLPR